MSEQPSPDDLAEAERLREDIGRDEVWSALNAFTDGSRMRSDLLHVMAEFDRLRLVEQAATTLAEALRHTPYVAHRGEAPFYAFVVGDCVKCSLLDVLAARTETS